MDNLRELASRLATLSGEVASIRRSMATPQLPYSSLDDASVPEKDAEGNVVSRWGKQEDGTHGVVVYDGPTPPVPGDFTAEGGPVSATVTWGGTYVNDVGRLDFHLIEVYASREPFEHIEDATLVGAIPDPDGGAVTFARPVGDWHIGLVTLSQAGKRSAVSALQTVTADSVVDQAIIDGLNDRLDGLGDDLQVLYDETLPELHSRLSTLRDETIPALRDRLADAEEVLGPLPGALDQAQAAADAAQQAADAAAGAAGEAQAEAEAAAQAALDAAGIAEGKGQVIVQVSKPTGSRARAENLWVRLPDHKVHIYEDGQWVAATDPDLIAAAGEAAQARQDAAGAAQAAQDAADRAEAAHDRAEALEGQVGTLTTELEAAQAALAVVEGETLPALNSELATLRDETIPDLQAIVGPLPAAVSAAQDAADDAAAAAAAAQGTADQAVQDALDAAGIAEGKGQVIVQATAPTGSRARPENLWVRKSDSKVHVYDPDAGRWVAATDPDLIEAAGVASDALAAAQAAQADADALADRAEALEGQVGTLTVDLETLREDTIPALQDIVGPLPSQVQAAQDAADAAQGRADAAHDDLADLAGEVAGKSALHYGDDAPEDTNALWIKSGVPHVYVDHGAEAYEWVNADTGLANWSLYAGSGGSAEYKDGVIILKGYGSRADSPLIPVDGPSGTQIRAGVLVKMFGRAPGREDESSARVLLGYRWLDQDGEPTNTTPNQSASALYVREGQWDQQNRNLGVNDHIAAFGLRVSLSSQWTGEEVHIAAPHIHQGPRYPLFDGDTPGFQWDGERWASTSSYAGPGWYPVNDPDVREAAARAQAARDQADTAHDRAEVLESQVGSLQTALGEAEEALGTLRDTDLPGLRDRLDDAEYDLRNFSAEWITAGTLDTARLNAEEVAGAVATFLRIHAEQITAGLIQGSQIEAESVASAIGSFLRLNAEQITAGKIGTARLEATEVAAAIGTYLDLRAEQITSGTINTDRLNADVIASRVANLITINANQITTGELGAERINVAELAVSLATVLSLDAGAITSGTIDTERLDAEAIGAEVGEFITLSAGQITAGELGADRIAVNELFTEMFAAHKITANEADLGSFAADEGFVADLQAGVLTVGSVPPSALVTPPGAGGNAIPDPHFQSTALTDLRRAARGTSWNVTETTEGRYLHRLALGGQVFYYAPELTPEHAIPVTPGSGWQFSIPVSGRASATLGIEWIATDGTTHTQDLATISGTAEQQWIQGEWAAPADAVAAAPFVRFASAAQTVRVHGGGRMESYSLPEQVVDMWRNGRTTIDGGHIETGTVKAHHLDAESLETDTALIGHLVAGIAEADLFVGREFLGGTFTGSTFRTTGDRLRLDDDGLTGRNPDGTEYLAINDDSGGTVTLRVQPGNLPDGDRLFPAGTLQFEHVPGVARAGIGWTDEVLPRFIVGRPGSGSEPSINLAAGLLIDSENVDVRGGGAYGGFISLNGESRAGSVVVAAGSAHQPNLLLTNTETVLWGEQVRVYGGSTRFEHDVEFMGDLLTPGLPWRMAAGKAAGPTSSERTAGPVRVYFPTGRFTEPPIVNVTSDNGLNASMATTVTTTYFEIHTHRIYGQAVYSHNVYWTAVQMFPSSAEG